MFWGVFLFFFSEAKGWLTPSDESVMATLVGNMEFLDQQKDWRALNENLQTGAY